MAAVAEPKIQEIPNSESEDTADEEEEEEDVETSATPKQSRNEKKARQALGKLGLKPFPGITRVTVRQTRNLLFVVAQPDVYRLDDRYVVFGDVKIEDLNAHRAKEALKDISPGTGSGVSGNPAATEAALSAATSSAAAADAGAAGSSSSGATGTVDAGDLKEDDISLVMKQAKCEREDAIKALKENDSDIVNAIMALSRMS